MRNLWCLTKNINSSYSYYVSLTNNQHFNHIPPPQYGIMKDKVIWISGASSGIGAALAQEYYKRGAYVILSARREQQLQALATQLGARAAVLPMDVTDIATMATLHDSAVSFFGPIDILINNAGISQRGSVIDTDIHTVQKIMNVNFIGNVALAKAVLPSMLARSTGHIVVISSLVGKLSTPFRSSYAASKHALHGYYDALRAEVADQGVQVHLICPGYIKTDISLHALNASGNEHGVMDQNQANGMSPDLCANKIVDAVKSGKREYLVGGKETYYVLIRRFMPSIYYNIIAKMAKNKEY